MLFYLQVQDQYFYGKLVNGRVNSFLRGSRKHDLDLRRKDVKGSYEKKTTNEKFIEIDGKIKLIHQKFILSKQIISNTCKEI